MYEYQARNSICFLLGKKAKCCGNIQLSKPKVKNMQELFEYEVGGRKFVLDAKKAKEAFDAKRVILGLNSPEFNVMPLKYKWAYEIYRDMEANHWLPQEVPMYDDIKQ